MGYLSYFNVSGYQNTDEITFKIPILVSETLFNEPSGTWASVLSTGGDGTKTIKNLVDQIKILLPEFENKINLPVLAEFANNIPSGYNLSTYYNDLVTELVTPATVQNWVSGVELTDVNDTQKGLGAPTGGYSQYDDYFSASNGTQTTTRFTMFDFGMGVDYLNRTGLYERKQATVVIPLFPQTAIRSDGTIYFDTTQCRLIQLYFYLYENFAWRCDINIIPLSTTNLEYFLAWINGQKTSVPAEVTDDPYIDAGYPPSTAPGGLSQGSFDFTEDGLTGVHTPSIDVMGTGFVTCWNPSKAQLTAVASWLWSTQPAQILQDLLGNPINAIIGLNILPVQPAVDGGTNTIHFGPEDTAVAAPMCTSQYVTVDCGSLKIEPKYGSYMDYAPPAGAELFLPYCGGVPLDINDVIDKTITIKYQVDILSGACVAYVFVEGTLHYQKAGACAATVPITGVQMPNVVSGALSIIGAVAGGIASLGATGAGTAAKVASGIATGTSIASTAANMLKHQISYSGTVSGWAGLLGAQTPYIILTLPHAAIPGGQNVIMGYPAWVSGRIGDFSGYTECRIDHVYALGATDAEVDEIKTLLEGGVIL